MIAVRDQGLNRCQDNGMEVPRTAFAWARRSFGAGFWMIHATAMARFTRQPRAGIGERQRRGVHWIGASSRSHLPNVADAVPFALFSRQQRAERNEGGSMHRKSRLLIAVAVLISGCALQDTRYDNSGIAAGFGPDYDNSILDWNFPTTNNQGPLLPPERFRPVRPAIGVPWATGNPMPWQQGDRAAPEGALSTVAPNEPRDCRGDCEEVASQDATAAVADARVRELSLLPKRN